jgi:hypothetical protein
VIETWWEYGTADSTLEEMQAAIHSAFHLDFPKEHIAFIRETRPAEFNADGTKKREHVPKCLLPGEKFGVHFEKYFIRHRVPAGTTKESPAIVDSDFMLKVKEDWSSDR